VTLTLIRQARAGVEEDEDEGGLEAGSDQELIELIRKMCCKMRF
jgi:hypothetical protein